jgi:hypothetical protein
MATKATLAALAKLTGMREGVLARTARADFADDPARFKEFSVTLDDLLFDYSKQRIDAPVLAALVELAKACGVEAKREAMFAGEKINVTESARSCTPPCAISPAKPVRSTVRTSCRKSFRRERRCSASPPTSAKDGCGAPSASR